MNSDSTTSWEERRPIRTRFGAERPSAPRSDLAAYATAGRRQLVGVLLKWECPGLCKTGRTLGLMSQTLAPKDRSRQHRHRMPARTGWRLDSHFCRPASPAVERARSAGGEAPGL